MGGFPHPLRSETPPFYNHVMKFLLENLWLVLLVLVSGGLLAWPVLRQRAGGPSLGTLAATQLMNSRNVQIVDVRTPAEFGAGTLLNARNVPLTDVAKRAGELRKDQPVIVVCEFGRRASLAAVKLRSAGISEVYILQGGVSAWRTAGLPLAKA
jgi:rhodanese-related sulfurtransferase